MIYADLLKFPFHSFDFIYRFIQPKLETIGYNVSGFCFCFIKYDLADCVQNLMTYSNVMAKLVSSLHWELGFASIVKY